MATITTTQSAAIASALVAPHFCYLCGRQASASYSHTVSGVTYLYVWCAACSFGQHMGVVAL